MTQAADKPAAAARSDCCSIMPLPQPEERVPIDTAHRPLREESDYGSDFDEDAEAEVIALLQNLSADETDPRPFILEDIENEVPASFAQVPNSSPAASQLQRDKVSSSEERPDPRWTRSQGVRALSEEVEYSSVSRSTFMVPHEHSSKESDFEPVVPTPADVNDTRTPLQRFRTAPKKPLSVTDMVSPAWCELQYWYTLTKYGKKRRTPAMKQGTAVHKVLEEQVHQTVQVNVQSREDHWGLRIWNVITGLRTLRGARLTRELEVWGVIDGQVINGIIDELSFDCTDSEMEAALLQAEMKENIKSDLPQDQLTISEFFTSSSGNSFTDTARKAQWISSASEKIYITDVKTRGSASLPKGASLRPTIMQLMLYRKLISDLVYDRVDSEAIFQRYSLDSSAAFSDALIAQLGNLELAYQLTPSSEEPYSLASDSRQDIVSELIQHNSLAMLWRLMIHEYQQLMPLGDASISHVLRAEFRSAQDGNVLGARTFPHVDKELQEYIDDEMKWWRGEREPRGVDIEDAFKCRMCDFADECTWRIGKIEEALRKARLRAEGRKKSEI